MQKKHVAIRTTIGLKLILYLFLIIQDDGANAYAMRSIWRDCAACFRNPVN